MTSPVLPASPAASVFGASLFGEAAQGQNGLFGLLMSLFGEGLTTDLNKLQQPSQLLDPNGLLVKLVDGQSATFAADLMDIIAQLKAQGDSPELVKFLEGLNLTTNEPMAGVLKEKLASLTATNKEKLLEEVELLLQAAPSPAPVVTPPPIPVVKESVRPTTGLDEAGELLAAAPTQTLPQDIVSRPTQSLTPEERSMAALDKLIEKLSGGQPIMLPSAPLPRPVGDTQSPLQSNSVIAEAAEISESIQTVPILQELVKSIRETLAKDKPVAAAINTDEAGREIVPQNLQAAMPPAPLLSKETTNPALLANGETPIIDGLIGDGEAPTSTVPTNSGQPATQKTSFHDELNAVKATHGAPHTPVANQVAVHLQRAAQDGQDRITIRLQPPELGRIDVKLEVGVDGRVMAQVTADNSVTLDLLRRDQSGLERALTDAGLKTDGSSLNFNLRGDGQRFSGGASGGEGQPQNPAFDAAAGTSGAEESLASALELSWFVSPERVDVRI